LLFFGGKNERSFVLSLAIAILSAHKPHSDGGHKGRDKEGKGKGKVRRCPGLLSSNRRQLVGSSPLKPPLNNSNSNFLISSTQRVEYEEIRKLKL
jgi:hypothetical protein